MRYKEGDHGKALCECCKELVPTTFRVRDLPISEGKGAVKGVLAIVCDQCGTVCGGFPDQSLAQVQQAVREAQSSLTLNEQKRLLAALNNPPKATEKLKKLLSGERLDERGSEKLKGPNAETRKALAESEGRRLERINSFDELFDETNNAK